MNYAIEIWLPNQPKYNGTFNAKSAKKAAEKVNNNVLSVDAMQMPMRLIDVEHEISNLSAGLSIIYWCEETHGAFARVTAK